MVQTAKLYSIGIIFFISVVSSILVPFALIKLLSKRRLVSSERFKKVIGALNCLSAGVFISTSLLILLPEAREMMKHAFELLERDSEFPVTEVLLGAGFLLILLIESIVDICYYQQTGRKAIEVTTDIATASLDDTENEVIDAEITSENNPTSAVPDQNRVVPETSSGTTDAHKDTKALQNVSLLLALSIHMVFDGLGIGLLEEPHMVWSMLLAVTIHKVLIFFSLGLHTIEATTKFRFFISMLYISAVSPIGIGIGILLLSDKESVAITTVSGVLQSVAAGTFMYVSLFEILLKEISSSESRLSNALFVILGFCIFAGIVYVNP